MSRVKDQYHHEISCNDEIKAAGQAETLDELYGEPIITAVCDVCSCVGIHKKSALKRGGWGLYPNEQFCPQCEAEK